MNVFFDARIPSVGEHGPRGNQKSGTTCGFCHGLQHKKSTCPQLMELCSATGAKELKTEKEWIDLCSATPAHRFKGSWNDLDPSFPHFVPSTHSGGETVHVVVHEYVLHCIHALNNVDYAMILNYIYIYLS